MTKEVKGSNSNIVVPSGSQTLQYLAALSATLAIVIDGMHYGWASPSVEQFKNNETCQKLAFCVSEHEGSWLAVMPLVGAVAGSMGAASVVDILGRKRTILATCVPFFIAWVMVAFANSSAVLFVARFIAGLADGVTFTVVPMYVGEIADPDVRGMLGSCCSVTWIAGYLIISVIGSYLPIKDTALISAAVPVLLFVTFLGMPESPYFLLMRQKVEGAKKELRRLKKVEDVDDDINRMTTAMRSEVKSDGRSFFDLFTVRSNRKAVFIMLGLRGFQQLSGTTAIAFYLHEIFKTSGGDHLGVIVYFSVQLVCTMLSSLVVDRVGRRPLLIISMSGSAVALFIEGTYMYLRNQTDVNMDGYNYILYAGLVGFVIIFSVGMQSIPICMLGELFPTNVKASALCLADIYYSLMATIATQFLLYTKLHFGLYSSFYGFTVASLVGLAFIILYVPETKGKTLEEIQEYFRNEDVKEDDEEEVKV